MKHLLAALIVPISLCALNEEPWFGQIMEFRHGGALDAIDRDSGIVIASYGVEGFFSSPLSSPTSAKYHLESEIAFETKSNSAFRAISLQGRRLWFNDIAGDPLSLTTGITYSFHHNQAWFITKDPLERHSFELTCSLGKEFSKDTYWKWRLYALVSVGVDSDLSIWTRINPTLQYRLSPRFALEAHWLNYIGSMWSTALGAKLIYETKTGAKFKLGYTHEEDAWYWTTSRERITLELRIPFSL